MTLRVAITRAAPEASATAERIRAHTPLRAPSTVTKLKDDIIESGRKVIAQYPLKSGQPDISVCHKSDLEKK